MKRKKEDEIEGMVHKRRKGTFVSVEDWHDYYRLAIRTGMRNLHHLSSSHGRKYASFPYIRDWLSKDTAPSRIKGSVHSYLQNLLTSIHSLVGMMARKADSNKDPAMNARPDGHNSL